MKSKKCRLSVIFFTTLTLIFNAIIVPSKASAGEIDVLGFKVTWTDPLYIAANGTCGRYPFAYKNNLGGEALNVRIDLLNKYGVVLGSDSVAGGVKNGISGVWNILICGTGFNAVPGPYEAKVSLKDYFGNTREGKSSVTFLPIPTATPSPTPTVTVTAQATPIPAPTVTAQATPIPAPTVYITNPADDTLRDLVSSLKSQISMLDKKLKKICSVKPKPKYC